MYNVAYSDIAEDRGKPREKMSNYGASFLSDQELLSVILGSGVKGAPVFDISKKLLQMLDEMQEDIQIDDLIKITGLGKAKSLSLLASLELGRRMYTPRKWKIRTPEDIFPLLVHYADRTQEHFLVYPLNGANEVISHKIVSIGLLNRTLVHPREVFEFALTQHAASIVIAHNHPSGNVQPSKDDIEVTNRLVVAGKILDIKILDHIIFSVNSYYSFLGAGDLQ